MTEVNNYGQAFKYHPNLTIIGVGGCGKKLAREIFKHDWLLKHYSSELNKLKVLTLDADASEVEEDKWLEEEINKKISSLDVVRRIEFNSFYLPYFANVSYVSDLASSSVSANIKESQSIDTWWLNDPEAGISFQDLKRLDSNIKEDFGGGVHRRRAISKAILYKVLSQQTNGFPTFSTRGVTAIIVGIGGGTGSGVFIDLARHIKSKWPDDSIYLFAVLPTTNEGEKEQLNAAIALTELEYLNVTKEEGLFSSVIFTSLGPTEYASGKYEMEAVREFDSAFPQIITNFFHVENSDLHLNDAKKSYSSFIFADAHVIEYPVEELKELKKQYSQIIQELEIINDEREKINLIIGNLLNEFNLYDGSLPTMEIFDFIKSEYRKIEKVWTNTIANLLNYHSVERVEQFIKYQISDIEFDKITKYNDLTSYISRVSNFDQSISQDKLKDEDDKKLFSIIPKALKTLEVTANLFKRVTAVKNELCRSVMIDILKGKKDVSTLLAEINSRNHEVQMLKDRLKQIDEKKNELNNLYVKVDKESEDKLRDIDLDIGTLADINRKIKNMPEKEKRLKEALDRYIDNFTSGKVKGKDKSSWYLSAGTKDIIMIIDEVLEKTNYDHESLIRFVDSITLYYYYKNKMKEVENGGWLLSILGKKKQLIKKYKEFAGKEEDHIKSSLKNWEIRIDPPFSIVIDDDFLTCGLSNKAETIRRGIFESVFSSFNIDGIDQDKLNQMLVSEDRGKIRQFLRDNLRNLLLEEVNYFNSIKELDAETKDLNIKMEEEIIQCNFIFKVDTASTETFAIRSNFAAQNECFFKHFKIIGEKLTAGSETKKGTYRTKYGNVNPQILSLIEGSDTKANPDMSNLDMDPNGIKELNQLINIAKSEYQSLFENRKLGINSLKVSINETDIWKFKSAALVVSSSSAYVRSELDESNINREINQSLSLDEIKNSVLTTHKHTKPWEITLTFFAATSFLDNIHSLVAGGGYWKIYSKNKENILHHALKLQDGKYVTRKVLLDSKEAGGIAEAEKKGEISLCVKSLYEIKSLKEALGNGAK